MLKQIVFRATLVAMFATVIALPTISLADEATPAPDAASQDGRTPPREDARAGRERSREAAGHESNRPEVRRCLQAVHEHGGNREDLRRCLAHAGDGEATRPEVRRCIEAVREHGGNRDDLRRCLAEAGDKDAQRPANVPPTSLLERVPEPAPVSGSD